MQKRVCMSTQADVMKHAEKAVSDRLVVCMLAWKTLGHSIFPFLGPRGGPVHQQSERDNRISFIATSGNQLAAGAGQPQVIKADQTHSAPATLSD